MTNDPLSGLPSALQQEVVAAHISLDIDKALRAALESAYFFENVFCILISRYIYFPCFDFV